MTLETTKWDIQDSLNTPDDIAAYLAAAFESGDTKLITAALGDVAKSKGMTALERETGISRKGLYKALSGEGDPKLSTILEVLNAFGLQMHVEAAE